MQRTSSALNNYFDHIYVLNLGSRPDRKLAMLQKLRFWGIKAEFVDAVDGYSDQNREEYQAYLNRPLGDKGAHPLEQEQNRKLIGSPGAWGYLKTYIGILQDARRRNFERILCLDDDVLFHKDFETRFVAAVATIPADWKLLYLGASQFVWKIPEGLTHATESDRNPKLPWYHPVITDGSFAIGIHAAAFDILLYDVLQMNCPFDSGPLRSVVEAFPKKCFVLSPNLMIADVSDSDIRNGENQAESAKRLRWELETYHLKPPHALVSIAMPAFNAEDTISKAIQSVLQQSFRDLELIVVDDKSTDKTLEVANQIAQHDQRVKVISLPQNVGVGAARNVGISIAKGDFIGFQDADDISLKHRITLQLLPIYEKEVLFSVCRIYRSRCKMEEFDLGDEAGNLELVESRRKKQKDGSYGFRDRAQVGLVTALYQRQAFEKFGLFEEHRFGEDLEFLERIFFFTLQAEFDDRFNGHSFLEKHRSVPGIFQALDEVLYFSSDMTSDNLSSQHKKGSGRDREMQSRQKFHSGVQAFPKLEEGIDKPTIFQSQLRYATLKLNTLQVQPNPSPELVDAWLEASQVYQRPDRELKKLRASLSWKITAPIRWAGSLALKFFRMIKN